MAVIVREDRVIGGRKIIGLKVYKSDRLLTREAKKQAEELDCFLEKKMKEITKDMVGSGLLELKGKKGAVLKLWYEVGKRLSFVMDTKIVPAEDRKYVWRALYDHAELLAPGPLSVRARERPETSHFKYCWRLSHFPWEFVESAGNWTAWVEFFDSIVIRGDERIIDWLRTKQACVTSGKQDWLRNLTRAIRREFKGYDTTIYSDEKLNSILEKIFNEVYGTVM